MIIAGNLCDKCNCSCSIREENEFGEIICDDCEQNAAEAAESIILDGWELQRRCAHLKADLSRFGSIDGDVLTCQMHGWKWRLTDGKCLTAVGHNIRSAPAGEPAP